MDRAWTRTLGRLLATGARAVSRSGRGTSPRSGPGRGARSRPGQPGQPGQPGGPGRDGGDASPAGEAYPGDFTGVARVEYAPSADDRADPGEVVWGWVPYEEDHSRGKDRPALVVARDGRWVLALMLTSRDHDTGPAHRRDDWMDVGSGAWDARGRPSEVRLDRVLRLDPDGIRREGARLDERVFDRVAAALRQRHGWS